MEFRFDPIGFVVSGAGEYPQEAPRQAVYASNEGIIELVSGHHYEQALEDLEGFDRIWLTFVFDRNRNWSPKVQPPDGSDRKRGVFATRSPHRPNPIGISAVELVKIDGLRLFVRNLDLLDGTPILDIKPYVPAADAFPEAKTGWRGESVPGGAAVEFSPAALAAVEFIRAHGGPDLCNTVQAQLGSRQLNPKRQRLRQLGEAGRYELAFRTWRIDFEDGDSRRVTAIRSGYSVEELQDDADPYCDKELHRCFERASHGINELP